MGGPTTLPKDQVSPAMKVYHLSINPYYSEGFYQQNLARKAFLGNDQRCNLRNCSPWFGNFLENLVQQSWRNPQLSRGAPTVTTAVSTPLQLCEMSLWQVTQYQVCGPKPPKNVGVFTGPKIKKSIGSDSKFQRVDNDKMIQNGKTMKIPGKNVVAPNTDGFFHLFTTRK